jgi:hypothetical protein
MVLCQGITTLCECMASTVAISVQSEWRAGDWQTQIAN